MFPWVAAHTPPSPNQGHQMYVKLPSERYLSSEGRECRRCSCEKRKKKSLELKKKKRWRLLGKSRQGVERVSGSSWGKKNHLSRMLARTQKATLKKKKRCLRKRDCWRPCHQPAGPWMWTQLDAYPSGWCFKISQQDWSPVPLNLKFLGWQPVHWTLSQVSQMSHSEAFLSL